MQYTTGNTGKIIVMRLEDGDPMYDSIIKAAEEERIQHGMVWVIGGIQNGGIVVGPEDNHSRPPVPMTATFTDAHEIMGVGTLFPNSDGKITLHMHAAMGRGNKVIVGCPRNGADCWLINEVVIMELTDVKAKRVMDEKSGFELLEV